MKHLQVFNYKGNKITFKKDGELYANATEMAKPFGKNPNDWLRLSATISYLTVLSITTNRSNSDYQLVITRRGAPETGGGTWIHESALIEYARWLSIEFAIWCNDRIRELLKTGITTLNSDGLTEDQCIQLLKNPTLVSALLRINESYNRMRGYLNKVRDTDKLYSMEKVCKIIKPLNPDGKIMGTKEFCADLRKRGILYKRNKRDINIPHKKYIDKEWFVIKERDIGTHEKPFVVLQTMITETGKMALYNFYNQNGQRLLAS